VDVAELLADLAHVPPLPQAACRGQWTLYDATVLGAAPRDEVMAARRVALRLCQACPVLADCKAWVDGLPRPQRPCGVVAGRLLPSPQLRPDRASPPRPPTKTQRCAAWLRGILARGAIDSPTLFAAAHQVGFKRCTVLKAGAQLGIDTSRRVPGNHNNARIWVALPERRPA
jgi:hypothetical protein